MFFSEVISWYDWKVVKISVSVRRSVGEMGSSVLRHSLGIVKSNMVRCRKKGKMGHLVKASHWSSSFNNHVMRLAIFERAMRFNMLRQI
jgi:hypothetical protein